MGVSPRRTSGLKDGKTFASWAEEFLFGDAQRVTDLMEQSGEGLLSLIKK
jgi:hypothetical protein